MLGALSNLLYNWLPTTKRAMVSCTTEQVAFFFLIQELCLHTKLLASPNTSIADFLSKAAEPPPFLVLRNAVALLKVCSDNQGFVYIKL